MHNFTIKSTYRSYEVRFIEDTERILTDELKEGDFIIIDNNIVRLYQSTLKHILGNCRYYGIDATEYQKSYEGLIPVIDHLIRNDFKKNHRLIAIGGGITQDVTAFIASILYRGVSWIFFPTTLLAQGDSCIGSKTSVNYGKFKNQLGGFYPPEKIFINPGFLKTLGDDQLQSGLGEMCHYFVIAGESEFQQFKNEYPLALENQIILNGIIERSLRIKKSYIEIDEFDQKERQIFNYGHSFGHAIESLTDYRVPHGIAVSYGMDMANFISVKLGYLPEKTRMEIRELLAKIWAGFPINEINIEEFKIALGKDKKNVGKELRLILNKGYGKIFKEPVKMELPFTHWLEEYFINELI